MRKGKVVIGLFTAILVLVTVLLGIWEYNGDGSVEIIAELTVGDMAETIHSWEKNDEEVILFLPSFADNSQITMKSGNGIDLHLEDQNLEDWHSLANMQQDVPYSLQGRCFGEKYQRTLTILQSEKLPTLFLDTISGNMDYIHKKLGNAEQGSFRLYTAEGTLHCAGEVDNVRGRGNTTWECKKKPYNLKLKEETDLLGMGTADRWVLLANALDATNLKDKLAYDLAQNAAMAFSPQCQWVDLYLNGEYAGLYLLSEHNEVQENRVDISQENSFLVVKDLEWRMERKGNPYVMTESNAALRICHNALPEGRLLQIFQSAENAILAADGIDPITGKHWTEMIDLDSWAEKYLIEEILGSTDAGTLSQFYYYDSTLGDEKIYAGPLWDMDLILRHSGGEWLKEQNKFYGNLPHVYGSPWLHALYQDPVFYERLTQMYSERFLPLLIQLRDTGLDAYAKQIQQAAKCNEVRWEMEPWEAAVEETREILKQRIDFLNRIWVEKAEYVVVTIDDIGGKKRSIVIERGDTLLELADYAQNESIEFHGWYYRGTKERFEPTTPIWEDVELTLYYVGKDFD